MQTDLSSENMDVKGCALFDSRVREVEGTVRFVALEYREMSQSGAQAAGARGVVKDKVPVDY